MKTIKPCTELYAVCDPQGNIVHTCLSTKPDEAIEEWLKTEQAMNWIGNLGRAMRQEGKRYTPSWEGYEAEGYTIEEVEIHHVKRHAEHI